MSTIVEGVVAYLNTQSGVTTLTSSRIRASQADEADTMPYILLDLVSDVGVYEMDGEAGIAQSRLQVRCVGGTPKSALDVSEAVRAAMAGYRGAMGTVQVRQCHRSNRTGPEFSSPRSGSQVGRYSVRMDFLIGYNE